MDDIKELLTFDTIIKNNLIEKQLIKQAEMSGVDLYECKTNPWKALLKETGALLFPKKSGILKIDKPIQYNNYNLPSNKNIYDLYKLDVICNIYIYLSQKYNKLIAISYYGYLINLTYEEVYNILNLKNHNNSIGEFNAIRNNIYKRLINERENNLKEKCFESPGAVGAIAIGNTENGWNTGNATPTDQDKVYQIDSLPNMAALPGSPENTDLLQDNTNG